ncbi:multicopper oxidase family protein [Pseudomonadota bacterium]|nr:multicopper oxidase family protein [Pseudomonadota bacterium]
MLSRRNFTKRSLASFLLTALPSVVFAKNKIINYKLSAEKSNFNFDKNFTSNLWLYNHENPGPLLKANKGDILKVNFTNNLDEPTSIHWHGIKNINKMDGVPYLTQDPVQPGETFSYEFPVNQSGTYWYHAHFESWKQVAKGLYGPLVVNDKTDDLIEDDIVILADDWRLNKKYQIDKKSFGSLMDWSHAGRVGNWLTMNGKKSPQYSIKANSLARLRFINASNARILKFGSSLKNNNIIAIDGVTVKPMLVKDFTLAPGQRIDLLINSVDLLKVDFFEISHTKQLKAFTLNVTKANNKTRDITNINFTSNWILPKLNKAKIINIRMQGGAMGNLSKANFDGVEKDFRSLATEDKKLWAFNKEIGSYEYLLAKVKLNQVVILDVWNDTRWPHSMHLHGNHFFVKSKEFKDNIDYISRDTYLMQAGEKAKLIFLADNPGKWLFHCHMLEHAASGMISYIDVA